MYDPKTKKFTLVATCFGTHHLNFARGRQQHAVCRRRRHRQEVFGWVNTKMFDETGDEQKSQGWTPFVVDTNGNGKRDDYVEPDEPLDPTKDKRVVGGIYGVASEPGRRHDLGLGHGFPGSSRIDPGRIRRRRR